MTMENLNEEQNARADALLVARNNLASKTPFGGSTVSAEIKVEDLVDLAEWVLSGKHPDERFDTTRTSEDVAIEDGTVLGLVSDAPKLVEHRELKDILPLHPGPPGAACSCGWHSHTKTWQQHIEEVLQDHPDAVVDSDDGPDFDGDDSE